MTLAQLTGAPLLMGFMYRTADYRRQVLEISAPVSADGEVATAFARCAAAAADAIRRSPAHWVYWPSSADLGRLGLIPHRAAGRRPQSQPAKRKQKEGFSRDESASVSSRG